MEFPSHLKYTEEHEWVEVKEGVATVGVTDYAQSELGDIVFMELPATGTTVSQGDVFGSIEAVKTVSDLYAPVSGEVVESNGELDAQPEVVNHSPYGDGWMIRIRITDESELGMLMDAEAYKTHIGEGS
jgi:glycine cleavage system H protein